MKIEVTRAFYIAGQVQPVGSVIDADDRLARELIHLGKAAAVAAKPAASAKPKKEPKE